MERYLLSGASISCGCSKRAALKGKRFGMLEVLEFTYMNNRVSWICKCDCGRKGIYRSDYLLEGISKHCGCAYDYKYGESVVRSWMQRLYGIWSGIKQRCGNEKTHCYARYGGKGVSIHPDWLEFSGFRDWAVAAGYARNLTIDRIDGNGNYEPGNCRWVTRGDNSRNRKEVKLSFEKAAEIRKLRAEGASLRELGLKYNVAVSVISRIAHNKRWEIEKVTPPDLF